MVAQGKLRVGSERVQDLFSIIYTISTEYDSSLSTNLQRGICHLSQLQSMMLQRFTIYNTNRRKAGFPAFIDHVVGILAAAAQHKSNYLDEKIR